MIFEKEGIKQIKPGDLAQNLGNYRLVDVRRSDEFTGELGHIAGASLATLDTPALDQVIEQLDPKKPVVFLCRSGMRSAKAAHLAMERGVEQAINMEGGMLAWNDLKLPVER